MNNGARFLLTLLIMIGLACSLKVIHSQSSLTAVEMDFMLRTIDGYFFSP